MTIWKYTLSEVGLQAISAPETREPLCVQVQNGVPCIWFTVDPESDPSPLVIRIFGTGHELDWDSGGLRYVGTYQQRIFVWHVFIQNPYTPRTIMVPR